MLALKLSTLFKPSLYEMEITFNEDDHEGNFIHQLNYGYVYVIAGGEYSVLDINEVRGVWSEADAYSLICYFDDDVSYLGDVCCQRFSTSDLPAPKFTTDIARIMQSDNVMAMTNLYCDDVCDALEQDVTKHIKTIRILGQNPNLMPISVVQNYAL
jgi:hypothetical protein